MADYDFQQLSPHDFELLSRDLVQARDGIHLESFKAGRDQGIDFRYAKGAANLIVQAKHYAGTGLAGLLRELRKEAEKAKKLNPDRYILTTSVGLTPQNKTEIMEIFGGLVAEPGDIVGRDDINGLLEQHTDVHQRHHKLWLTSRAVLDRVLHNAAMTQSDFDVERVRRDIARYVQNSGYPRAVEMLNDSHVAIISGAPGVGKTTLARMLLYAFLEQGYEAISILTDFQTGRELYQPGKKQIFYFDDFIGATFLGERASAFTRNEDRAILDFIEMVRGSKTARLVMTTREHILQQAVAASEKLKHSHLVDHKCVLAIRDYGRMQRAEILYNHIYFSDLPPAYRDQLLADRFYLEIIKHSKFNPRLIEWLSNYRRVKNIRPENYRGFVRNLLDDPAEIWRHAYHEQISDSGRSIMLALYTHRGECHPATLEKTFWSIHELRAQRYGFSTSPSDWRMGLGELAGSFVQPGTKIAVLDPSVLDMLNVTVREEPRNAIDMIEGATRFEEAHRVWTFAKLPANAPIMRYLTDERERVIAAFTRLLDAPDRKPFQGGVAFFDDSPAERLATMMDLAEHFQDKTAVPRIHEGMESLLKAWRTEHFDLTEGMALVSKTGESHFVFGPEVGVLKQKLLAELCRQAATGCWSNELRELIETIPKEEMTQEMREDLRKASEQFNGYRFSEELRQAKSGSDFEEIEEDLGQIAESLGMNLESAVQSCREARDEFEEYEERRADHMMDEWKEQRGFERAAERDVDDLFGSLKT